MPVAVAPSGAASSVALRWTPRTLGLPKQASIHARCGSRPPLPWTPRLAMSVAAAPSGAASPVALRWTPGRLGLPKQASIHARCGSGPPLPRTPRLARSVAVAPPGAASPVALRWTPRPSAWPSARPGSCAPPLSPPVRGGCAELGMPRSSSTRLWCPPPSGACGVGPEPGRQCAVDPMSSAKVRFPAGTSAPTPEGSPRFGCVGIRNCSGTSREFR